MWRRKSENVSGGLFFRNLLFMDRFFNPNLKSLNGRNSSRILGVTREHELTRKDRRLSSGLASLDALIDGGIPRGRISEITGRASSGKTSIAASFASFATRRGEVAAWLDASGSFNPESMAAAGVDTRRMLWASMKERRGADLGGGGLRGEVNNRQSCGTRARGREHRLGRRRFRRGSPLTHLCIVAANRSRGRAQRRCRDRDRALADVRDVRRPEHCCQSRRNVVQPARSRLAGDVRRTRS